MKKGLKRIFSILFYFALALSLIPGMGLTVHAEPNPVTVTLDKTENQVLELGETVSFTATIETQNEDDDKTVKWSTTGGIELYSDAACNTSVGTGATDMMTVYAKGVSKGGASVTVTSNYSETVSKTCPLWVVGTAPVSYQAWNGTAVTDAPENCTTYNSVMSVTTTMSEGWYVVDADVTIPDRITVDGEVNLILCDGVTMTVNNGIKVLPGNTLNIYGQSGGTGALISIGINRCAGIGGDDNKDNGTVVIHGGTVTATGGREAAGIGGGNGYSNVESNTHGDGGNVTIYGGTVTATGGEYAAGIGGGRNKNSGNISIYGGKVNATGASGIGTGCDCESSAGSKVTIYGGKVTANGRAVAGTSFFYERGTAGIGHGGYSSTSTYDVADPGPEVVVYGGKVITYGPEKGIGGRNATGELFVAGGAIYGSNSQNPEVDAGNLMESPFNTRPKYITILDHKHEWTSTVEGSTITSTCGNSDGFHAGQTSGMLTLNAPTNLIWDGNEKPASLSEGYNTIIFFNPEIEYSKQGDNSFSGIPTEEGTYSASVTINGATASVDYTIAPPQVEPVSYLDGTTEKSVTKYLAVAAGDTAWGNTSSERWLVVSDNVNLSNRVNVTGTVNLILSDGKTLNASKGFELSNGATLNIYAQSEGTGVLNAVGGSSAGIGGNGNVNINGGTLNASGSSGISTGLTLADGLYLYGGGTSGTTGPIIRKNDNYRRAPYMIVNRTPHETIHYQGEDGNDTETTLEYTVVSANWPGSTWSEGWYVVRGNVTISNRLTLRGTVNLILSDGATLNANKGITTTDATLNIYAQNEDTGILIATGENGASGIGGVSGAAGGSVNIWGGSVYTAGGEGAVGIGAGNGNTTHGSLNIAEDMSVAGGSASNPEKKLNSIVSKIDDDYKRSQYMTVKDLHHNHNWNYSAEGAIITATCGNSDGNHAGEMSATLSIIAPSNPVMDGNGKPATLSDDYDTVAFPDDYTITYTKDGEEFSGTPTEAGKYVASVTIDDATASVSYTIVTLESCTTLAGGNGDVVWGAVGEETWYTISQNTTINGGVIVKGNVNLVLEDGKELTINGRTQIGNLNISEGIKEPGSLTVYAQSEDESTMGKLTLKGRNGDSQTQVTVSDSYLGQNGGNAKDNETLRILGNNWGDGVEYGSVAIHGGIVNIIGGNGGDGQSIKATSFKTYTTGYGGSGGDGIYIYSNRTLLIDGYAIVKVQGGNGGNGGDGDSGNQSGNLGTYNVNRGGKAGCGISGASNGVVLGSSTARLTVIGGVKGRQGVGNSAIWNDVNSDTLTAYDGIAFGSDNGSKKNPVRPPVTTANTTQYIPMLFAGTDNTSIDYIAEYNGEMYVEATIVPKTCTVTFDLNGHGTNAPTPQTLQGGQLVTCPEDPADDGTLAFACWQDPEENAFQFESRRITGDITLKAVWFEKELEEDTVEEGEPTAGETEVDMSGIAPGTSDEVKAVLKAAAESVAIVVSEDDEEKKQVLENALKNAMDNIDTETKTEENQAALAALIAAGLVKPNPDVSIPEGTEIEVQREVYLKVQPKELSDINGRKVLVLEITPCYNIYASVGDNAPISVSGDNPAQIDKPIDLSVNLPGDFVPEEQNFVYVGHTHGDNNYTYRGELGDLTDGQRMLSFRSLGLSPFTITTDNNSMAAMVSVDVDDTSVDLYFDTLAAAVEVVKNGGTIKLLKPVTEEIESIVGIGYTIELDENVDAENVEVKVDGTKVIFENGKATIKAKSVNTKASQSKPVEPKLDSKTKDSITVKTVANQEYSIDNGKTWQSSGTFKGLTPDTEYSIVTRKKETPQLYASPKSNPLVVKTDAEEVHVHELNHVEAKEATCLEDGNKEYWECTSCEKLFADKDAETETTIEEVTIDKSEGKHTLKAHEAVEATCLEDGCKEYWECTACSKLFADKDAKTETTMKELTIDKSEGKHELTAHEAKEATCTEDGNKAYWECMLCEKLFEDSDAKKEITLADTVISAEGHNLAYVAAKEATVEEAGNTEYWYCEICKKCYVDAEGKTEIDVNSVVIPPIGKESIFGSKISVSDSCVYTGEAQTPKVVVTIGDKTLVEGEDYDITYSDNTNAGTAKVTVKAKGSYYGEATGTFTIAKKAITLGEMKFENKYYDGSKYMKLTSVYPKVNGVLSGDEVTVKAKLSRYVVTGTKSPGNKQRKLTIRQFTLSGKDAANYKLTKGTMVYGVIKKVPVKKVTLKATSVKYNGKSQKPVITGITGPESKKILLKNCTITYTRDGKATKDFKSKGTIVVKVTGTGFWKGSVSVKYVIK